MRTLYHPVPSRSGLIHCNCIAMSATEVSPEFLLDLVIGIITVLCNILMLLQAERIFQRTRSVTAPVESSTYAIPSSH